MKKQYKYFGLLLILLTGIMTSCSNDGASLLDRADSGDLDEDMVFANANYTNQYVTNGYSRLPNGFSKVILNACISDEAEAQQWNAWSQDVNLGAYNPSNINGISSANFGIWNNAWNDIRHYNKFLRRSKSYETGVGNDTIPWLFEHETLNSREVAKRMRYEMLFLRAFKYYELMIRYGGVPIVKDELSQGDAALKTPRASFADLVEFIVKDCDSAIKYLPYAATVTITSADPYPATLGNYAWDKDLGRITKSAAMALKAKVLLYAASPLFNNPDPTTRPTDPEFGYTDYQQTRWDKAANAAKDLIDLGHHTLATASQANPSSNYNSSFPYAPDKASGYYNIFISRNVTTSNMYFKENILSYQTTKNKLVETRNLPGSMQAAGNASTLGAYTLPSFNQVMAYETKTGKSIYQSLTRTELPDGRIAFNVTYNPALTTADWVSTNPYSNLDPRFYHTIWYNGSNWQGNEFEVYRGDLGDVDGTGRTPNGTHYITGKNRTGFYLRKFMMTTLNIASGNADHNFPIFRYSDILLMYAEALNESLSAPNQDVYDAVNQVRTRVDMPVLPTGLSKIEMRERIMNERRVELAFEDHRYNDLRRWRLAEKYLNEPIYEHDVYKPESGDLVYTVVQWEKRLFLPQMYLLPIPQQQINNSEGTLIQGPGW